MTQTQAVIALIEDYFNLAYEPKSRDFMKIFHPSCVVQWVQEGQLSVMSSQDYAALIHGRPSPRSIGAPRDEAILSMENISDILSDGNREGADRSRSFSMITSSCTKWRKTG
jgi:hypothetical protein